MEPPWDAGMKICSKVLGHRTKMASKPIYGKNLQNVFFLDQEADDTETWYKASSSQALPNWFK